jgi:hypothetical protein
MFTKLEAFLKGKKSHIIAFLLVLVACVNLYNGDMTLEAFLQDPNLLILLNGLGLSALRAAVAK